ncbi:MAG TPA: penicillin-binding protein 2 [Anaerolineales bacterium]|nr:penicillin-binding protein 2 [Anaerolineales bacterium]
MKNHPGMNNHPGLNNTIEPWRILTFAALVGVVMILYLFRLFNLQILQGAEWLELADENRISEVNLQTQRGIIYDRNGFILARNIPSYNVIITPAELPDDLGAVQGIYRTLSHLIDLPVNRGEVTPENPFVPCRSDHGITQIVNFGQTTAPFEPVRVKCNIDRELAMMIKERAVDWPGVGIEIESVRDYPTGSLTAAVIGFLGPISELEEQYFVDRGFVPNRDKVGYSGVERYFQSWLGGHNGERLVEVDVAGKILRDVKPPVNPTPGFNMTLTLDTRLQSVAEAILVDEINFWNLYLGSIRSTSGVVIALNPQTGEILAMVSYPTYENNRMARQIPFYYYDQLSKDLRNPLLNHAVGDELPAGSVFKLVTAVGALNEGVVTPEQVLDAPPKITIEEKYFANDPGRAREFVDWNKAGFGQIDFVHGVANSSNVYFYKLGGGYGDEVPEGLGICRLGTYARALGYGAAPFIELPLVEDGLIPSPTWKRINHGENWSTGDTYISSVGQGFVIATPIQVLLSAATIANDGVLVSPTILREIQDSEGNLIKSFLPDELWNLTEDPVIDVIADPNSPGGCENKLTGEKKTVQPWVIEKVQEGMRLAVLEGTLRREFEDVAIAAAGKTGTAEYCDKFANEKNLCIPGNWPTHAWTVAYAPYDAPEIAVVAFVYNGGEGASVAGPIVRRLLEAYFEIKAGDTTAAAP